VRVIGRPMVLDSADSGVMTIHYDVDGKMVGVGYFDGTIKMFNSQTGKLAKVIQTAEPQIEDQQAVSCIRFKPFKVGANCRSSGVMTALTSSGYLRNYSLTMDQMLSQNEMHYDNSNHLNCADFTCDGRRLMIGGSDQKVHLYEESGERRYAGAISERGFKVPGHAGRVFSIKCHPDDPNVAVSCAWDSNLKIYDMRARKPVATIYGPRPFGDCLDLFDDMCISGNYRAKEALSMYSISMQKHIYEADYSQFYTDNDAGNVMAARFSHDGQLIFTGDTYRNQVKIFMNDSDGYGTFRL
jgi:WD40 repeat protein